mmetsp:Transcript_70163/g.164243  ORF Transcript_70163/g.164243 Transcript_70163/m.164243 type:complete len:234 (-) Transcript_70163:315-1016(-)
MEIRRGSRQNDLQGLRYGLHLIGAQPLALCEVTGLDLALGVQIVGELLVRCVVLVQLGLGCLLLRLLAQGRALEGALLFRGLLGDINPIVQARQQKAVAVLLLGLGHLSLGRLVDELGLKHLQHLDDVPGLKLIRICLGSGWLLHGEHLGQAVQVLFGEVCELCCAVHLNQDLLPVIVLLLQGLQGSINCRHGLPQVGLQGIVVGCFSLTDFRSIGLALLQLGSMGLVAGNLL